MDVSVVIPPDRANTGGGSIISILPFSTEYRDHYARYPVGNYPPKIQKIEKFSHKGSICKSEIFWTLGCEAMIIHRYNWLYTIRTRLKENESVR